MASQGSVPQYHLEEEKRKSPHFRDLILRKHLLFDCDCTTSVSSPKVSNPLLLNSINAMSVAASASGHRALVLVQSPADGHLRAFANDCDIPFIAARHSSDRTDRIHDVLGSEFDILLHQTDEVVDVGLLAAVAGTVRAGGVLILAVPGLSDVGGSSTPGRPSSLRFSRLLFDMRSRFPDTVLFSGPWVTNPDTGSTAPFCSQADTLGHNLAHILADIQSIQARLAATRIAEPIRQPIAACHEQDRLLQLACNYLQHHQAGCITITGRRGRGKSALLGRIASWLEHQHITFAVTAARQSALVSMQTHNCGPGNFVAADAAHLSGCSVLLVDEASSLPLSLLERFLATHAYVIYCTTIEGYESAGRAFAIRFDGVASQYYDHALSLEPCIPWRWNSGDPLEHLIDALLLSSSDTTSRLPPRPIDNLQPQQPSPVTGPHLPGRKIRMLDRALLALDETLLRAVYGLLRDNHYQTSTVDLSHLLDAPDLQLWVLEEGGRIHAALLMVVEGEIDPELNEAIVSKQRRLPHQLLPQLLAQTADQADALQAVYGRVIRIAVASGERRRGLGTRLLKAVEGVLTSSANPAGCFGASFASDAASIAFWQKNGYMQFHTGFKTNPRTGKPAIAVIKSICASLDPVVQTAVDIHADNQRWRSGSPDRSDATCLDATLLHRFARGQRSMHDTYAALCRLATRHDLPLHQASGVSRRQYEAALRKAVTAILK